MTINHGRYEATVEALGSSLSPMKWRVQWFDKKTQEFSYFTGSREECITEAKLKSPTNPQWRTHHG